MSSILPLLLAAVFTRPMERVTTLDPAEVRSQSEVRAVGLLYESVLTIDYLKRPYALAPGFCELPHISDDGLTYTFVTRHGSAIDVVRSLSRLRDPARPTPNDWVMRDVASLVATDARTVVMTLKRPTRHFPWLMTMTATGVRTASGEGTGPYRLTNWWKNHQMIFTRRHPETAPNGFDEIRYLVIDDMSTQWLMFLKGELDFLGEVSRNNWDSILGANGELAPELVAKGIRLVRSPSLDTLYVGMNLRDPVLCNRKLRQALNAAFDYPAWEAFYNGRILPSDGPVPPSVAGYLNEPFAYRYNPELARRLLAEAGYPNGIDPQTGRRLVLSLTIGRANQESREAGELMAAFYDRIGIRLELNYLTWEAFVSAVNEGHVQLYRMGWVGDYPDAHNFLQLFYGPNAAPGVNHCCYQNDAYDRAFEDGDYASCQRILREDCPWIFTHFNVACSVVGPRVGNYVPSDFPQGSEQYLEAIEK